MSLSGQNRRLYSDSGAEYHAAHGKRANYARKNNRGASTKIAVSSVSIVPKLRLGCPSGNVQLPLSSSVAVQCQQHDERAPLRSNDLQGLWKYALHQPCRIRPISCEGVALDGRSCQVLTGGRTFSPNYRYQEAA